MCDEKHEQRINLKFLVKLKKTPTECYKLLQEAYEDNSLTRARIFEWCKRNQKSKDVQIKIQGNVDRFFRH